MDRSLYGGNMNTPQRFSSEQLERLQSLTGSPNQLADSKSAQWRKLLIDDVREALRLPKMPYSNFLSSQCWLAGGSVLRWLCGEMNEDSLKDWDFDFFFPSRKALTSTAKKLFASGYRFSRYSIQGTAWQILTKRLWPPIPVYQRWGEGEGFQFFCEIVDRTNIVALDVLSPEGDLLQLAGVVYRPSPESLNANSDFTICQFAMDDRYLYAGEHAWDDLINNRLRVENIGYPLVTLARLNRFRKRGFRPDARTIYKVSQAVLRRWRWPS
jgi:hypothetical protein